MEQKEQKPDFLDVMEQKINELINREKLTEEQLQEGISLPLEYFQTKELRKEIIVEAILMSMLTDERKKQAYQKSCQFLNRDPKDMSEIKVKKYKGLIQLDITGGDGWRKLLILKEPVERLKIQQITPQDFCANLFIAFWNDIRNQLSAQEMNLHSKQILKILKIVYSAQMINSIKDIQRKNLNKIAAQIIDEWEKSLDKKDEKTNQPFSTDGVTYREHDEFAPTTQERRKNGVNSSKLINKQEIPFSERDNVLINGRGYIGLVDLKDPNQPDNVRRRGYIYKTDTGDYLTIIEPLDENESGRVIFLRNAFQGTDNKVESPEFWRQQVEYYDRMSSNGFNQTENTYELRHRGKDSYIKSLDDIISSLTSGKMQCGINAPGYRRVLRVFNKLLFGNNLDLKQAAIKAVRNGGVDRQSLRDAEHALEEDKDKGGENRENG